VGQRIQSAYHFIAEHYQPGDEIYLFGFSRGAFQARSLGGLLNLVGIPKSPGAPELATAWQAYELRREAGHKVRIAKVKNAAHHPVPIKCIGVWDTVGNLGIPLLRTLRYNRRFAFHDVRLSPNVEVGLHALAIDEPRGAFSPALWIAPKGQAIPSHQRVEQVWFPGSHCDVGGGLTCSALSDASLIWMASRAHQLTGLSFDFDHLGRTTHPNPLGEQYSPTTRLYRMSRYLPYLRLINQEKRAVPLLRRALIGMLRTGPVPRNHRPVNEMLHPSAVERFRKPVAVRYGEAVAQQSYEPRTLALAIGAGLHHG
jgi:hypothetical protein